MDVAATSLAVVSVVLAVVATVLSILFYKWADQHSRESSVVLAELRSAIRELDRGLMGLREDSFALLRGAYSDMTSIARIGVRHSASAGVTLTEPGPSEGHEQDGDRGHEFRSDSISQVSVESIQEISLMLGSHMMRKRGAEFESALAELSGRIKKIIHGSAPGSVTTTGEIASQVAEFGFDVGEVVYVLAVMHETGGPGVPRRA